MSLDATHRASSATGSGDPLIGKQLGNFRIEEKIAEGGMGLIYRAVHSVIGRQAAIKVLSERYSSDRHMIKRLHLEAQAVNRIGHNNIIDIFDFGQTPDQREYFVMEFLPGESLAEILARDGRLPWSRTEQLMTQLLDALAAAHDLGIIHRDIKPENILVVPQPDGQWLVKVLDFGIAKSVGLGPEGEKLTRAGSVMGTPEYIAPEQIRAKPVDGRADLYAVGVILFEAVAGRRPYEADKVINLLMMHLRDPIPDVGEIPPEIGAPSTAVAVIRKAMAKKPDERFVDAREFARALGLQISEVRPQDGTRDLPQAFWESQADGARSTGVSAAKMTAPRATLPGATAHTAPSAEMTPAVVPRRSSPLRWIVPLVVLLASAAAISYAVWRRSGAASSGSGTGSVAAKTGSGKGTSATAAPGSGKAAFEPVKDVRLLLTRVRKVLRRGSQSGDPAVRSVSVLGIGELRDADAKALLLSIVREDPDRPVRQAAARALASLGDATVADELRKVRGKSAELMQVAVDRALTRLGQPDGRRGLVKALRSKQRATRLSAALALGELGDKRAKRVLLAQLARPDLLKTTLVATLGTAARLGHTAARKTLSSGLSKSSRPLFQLGCAEALARLGDEQAVATLKKLLGTGKLATRLVAAKVLASLGDYAGLDALHAGIRKRAAATRKLAAAGLSAVADRSALPPLAEALGDKRADVQAAVAHALARILALMPNQLVRRSQSWIFGALDSGDWAMRHAAVGVSAEMDPALAIELLGWALRDKDARVRAAAVASLGRLKRKSPRAIKILTVALADRSPEVRARAARALSGVKSSAVKQALSRAVRDPNSRVGIIAAGAMLRQGDTRHVGALKIAARQRNPRLRAAALRALGQWRSPKATPLLVAGLGDRSPEVRYAAALALARRGSKRGLKQLRLAVRSGHRTGEALRALSALGVSQRDQLRALARSKRASDRRSAMETARDLLAPAAAVGLLAGGAQDSDVGVRRAAAGGLVRVARAAKSAKVRSRATRALRALARDADPAVRASARIGLAQLEVKRGKKVQVAPVKQAPLPENVKQPQRAMPRKGRRAKLFVDDNYLFRIYKYRMGQAALAAAQGRLGAALRHLRLARRQIRNKPAVHCEIGGVTLKLAQQHKRGSHRRRRLLSSARAAFRRCLRYRPHSALRTKARRGLRDVRRLR